jgi:hypothetical protein
MFVPRTYAVPELTRSTGIQLNGQLSLRDSRNGIASFRRTNSPMSGPTRGKPSGRGSSID